MTKETTPVTPDQKTTELIVDVLTFIHAGLVGYEEYASEQVLQETATIRKRYQDLKKQGVPGVEAVRQAKVEWIRQLL
jgi:hypothetical protein